MEELVQQTFLACVQNRDTFRKQSSFRTYLFSIARFQLYHHLRKKGGEALNVQETSIADLGVSPRSQAVQKQERELLLQALCTLPVEQQLLLELFYWEGMDTPELAEVLEIPVATVRTRLFRARAALRECMEALADAPRASKTSVEDLDAWARSLRSPRSEET